MAVLGRWMECPAPRDFRCIMQEFRCSFSEMASSTHPHLFCEGRRWPLIVHRWLPQPPEEDRKEYVQSAHHLLAHFI